ncbi:hypothetical protein L2E82_17036 [Cichorium intybus]|uniref:Uncharacterized protein n=1 Tax=Cichorium intybus TaxID=13427 RepID=A0ACB9F7U4_CICIN|nr:hypothetical protein L2E82_17036 [Cichorium intybus]
MPIWSSINLSQPYPLLESVIILTNVKDFRLIAVKLKFPGLFLISCTSSSTARLNEEFDQSRNYWHILLAHQVSDELLEDVKNQYFPYRVYRLGKMLYTDAFFFIYQRMIPINSQPIFPNPNLISIFDISDDDNDEENDHEQEAEKEVVYGKPVAVLPPKDTDRQLSKKELKKKELAELDAVLTELGLNDNNNQEDTSGKRGYYSNLKNTATTTTFWPENLHKMSASGFKKEARPIG